jgi:hypothetical protein
MNKMDFLIKGLWYSTLIILGFMVVLIASIGLAFTPMWIQYAIALSVGFGLAHEKCKKK